MSETLPNATLDAALAEARETYVARNPASLRRACGRRVEPARRQHAHACCSTAPFRC